jgi:hypothetical protein
MASSNTATDTSSRQQHEQQWVWVLCTYYYSTTLRFLSAFSLLPVSSMIGGHVTEEEQAATASGEGKNACLLSADSLTLPTPHQQSSTHHHISRRRRRRLR